MASKRILVTGASGFTGRYFIAAASDQGHRCVALCQQPGDSIPGAESAITADLCDIESISKAIAESQPDIVVHLAAISFVAHDNFSEIYQVNLLGTLNLLAAISSQAPCVEKILIASSANIYGAAQTLPITEQTPPNPVNHYAMSKYTMERSIALQGDLPIVVVRPFNYTGIGQSDIFLVPKIVKAFKNRQASITLGNLDVSRDFSDVRDVVAAYLGLLELDAHSPVYNVCSGTASSLQSIIGHLNEIAGYEIKVESHSDFIRSDEIKILYGSDALLESAIGPYRRFGIRQTLEWMYGA